MTKPQDFIDSKTNLLSGDAVIRAAQQEGAGKKQLKAKASREIMAGMQLMLLGTICQYLGFSDPAFSKTLQNALDKWLEFQYASAKERAKTYSTSTESVAGLSPEVRSVVFGEYEKLFREAAEDIHKACQTVVQAKPRTS